MSEPRSEIHPPREEVTVRPVEVQRGDWLHLARDLWVQVDQHGKDEWRSFFWCVGLYYPVAIDRGSLVTVRRQATPSGRSDGSDV